VEHSVPTVAVKVTSKETGMTIVYSSDTEPCEALARLAQGADILIHEGTGDYAGHSTPAQAGAMARRWADQKKWLPSLPFSLPTTRPLSAGIIS